MARYKENVLFKDAFYMKKEGESEVGPEGVVPTTEELPAEEMTPVSLSQPAFGSFEVSEADEEEIYRQRSRLADEPTLPPDFTRPSEQDEKEPEGS